MEVLGEAWRIKTSRVPKELLDAFPQFQKLADTGRIAKGLRAQKEALIPSLSMYVDWRKTDAVPTPEYQGPYNTCTSFAVVATVETLHFLRHHSRLKLAPGFIHTCLLGREPNQGAAPEEAVDEITRHGIALGFPGDYPFPDAQCSTGSLYPIKRGKAVLGQNVAMETIATYGPIVADMFIEPSFLNLRQGEIYQYQLHEAQALHTVAVVGYDANQSYWIISNSFGTGWADGGFGLVRFGSGGLLDDREGWQILID